MPSLEMVDDFSQIPSCIHGDAIHQLPFSPVAGGDEDGRHPFLPGPEDHGKDTVHRPQGTIQGQFSSKDGHGIRQCDILFGSQDSHGDGQIQPSPIFF